MEHDRDNVIEFDRGLTKKDKKDPRKTARSKQVKAIQGIQVSANTGNSDGQFQLGMFFKSMGPDQDLEEAVVWLKRSARQGHPAAQFEVGGMYKTGEGVRKNRVLSMKWMLLATAAGDEDADIHSQILQSELSSAQAKRALVMAVRFRLQADLEHTIKEMMQSPDLLPTEEGKIFVPR